MLEKVDEMIIAGGMAFTFKKVIEGVQIGSSLFDKEGAAIVEQLVRKAEERNVKLHFPVDYVCGNSFSKDAEIRIETDASGIPEGWMGLDVGPESAKNFGEVIASSKTLLWNGPPGVFEFDKFSEGTKSMLEAVVSATQSGCITIIGGGDTAAAAAQFGGADKVSHVSTGGGASLELMEGRILPGVEALSDK